MYVDKTPNFNIFYEFFLERIYIIWNSSFEFQHGFS
jgi:hypothetical protein